MEPGEYETHAFAAEEDGEVYQQEIDPEAALPPVTVEFQSAPHGDWVARVGGPGHVAILQQSCCTYPLYAEEINLGIEVAAEAGNQYELAGNTTSVLTNSGGGLEGLRPNDSLIGIGSIRWWDNTHANVKGASPESLLQTCTCQLEPAGFQGY
jgi:hypothetical protein